MTETTIPTSLTPTGQVSAPELARTQGLNPVDYLRRRGFVYDITDEDGLRKAFDEGTVTYYQGFDPTGPSLHAGHMAGIMLLAHLQRLGHRPIALGGGGTAMVGDPSGRTSSRELITLEELESNIQGIMVQLGKYLDFEGGRFGDNPPALLLNNADWLLDLHYIEFLRDIGRHFNVNDMLNAETYKTRLETTGLNFVEFNYRLVQAYDFLHLFRTFGCTLQLGGSDQWGNIVAGVELIRKADAAKSFALVTPLVVTSTGEKMGKTGSGVRVWLDPERFSPYDYYQYWINTDDSQVESHLRRFTFIVDDVIDEITSVEGEALREAKRVLAYEATALAHGVDAAKQAESAAKSLFSRGSGPSADDKTLPTTEIAGFERDNEPLKLADAYIEAGLVKSRGEARRLAQSNGLSIDDLKVTDVDITLREAIGDRTAVLLRSGKKNFKRVVILNRDA
jgi:tyrosyl-tRNA synthetase